VPLALEDTLNEPQVAAVLPGVQLQVTPPVSLFTFASSNNPPLTIKEPGSGFGVLSETVGLFGLFGLFDDAQATKTARLRLANNPANIRVDLVIPVGFIKTLLEVSCGGATIVPQE
jgi:hypothetical protein